MRLEYIGTRFRFFCEFAERHIPKESGFRWDAADKVWYTQDPAIAAKLREYATVSANERLYSLLIEETPWLSPLSPLPAGRSLMPHQEEAVRFALSRNRSYLGLDPGLGKTIVAAVIAANLDGPVAYISPPFLVRNVEREFNRFAPGLEVCIVGVQPRESPELDVMIIPDSLIARESIYPGVKRWVGAHDATIIVDEAHRFKNPTAKRTQALLGRRVSREKPAAPGLVDLFKRQVYMSGTPMPNRPMELYALLSKAAPETIGFMKEFDYGRRYCAGRQSDYGWDFTGASNVPELARGVIAPTGPFMLRQRKALLGLPPKTEEVFLLADDMSPRLMRLNQAIADRYDSVEDLIKKAIADEEGKRVEELSTASYRRLLGAEKVAPAAEFIASLLDEGEQSVLVFAYHKDVVAGLAQVLSKYKPLVITGATPKDQRQRLVDEFQASEGPTVLIGNYLAAGIGFTLTKATRVVFVEYSWVPGDNDQAGDRAHRIGQDQPVHVQYMVYRDSIDQAVIETLLRKRRAIDYV